MSRGGMSVVIFLLAAVNKSSVKKLYRIVQNNSSILLILYKLDIELDTKIRIYFYWFLDFIA